MRQEHRPRFSNSGSVSTKPIQGIHQSYSPLYVHRRAWKIIKIEGDTNNVQQGVNRVSNFDGKRQTTFWNCLPKSASIIHTTTCQLSSSYKDRSGLENKTTIRRPVARLGMTRIAICAASPTSGQDFSVVRRFGGKRRDEGVGHGQDTGTALCEKFYDCSREALRAAHREMETVKVRLD